MTTLFFRTGLLAFCMKSTWAVTFNVPSTPPSNASAQLDPNPVGVSLEFFTFPDYFNEVPSTQQCLQNLADVAGTWPPLRIGGTTQDRALYNASSPDEVTYSVADPADAPDSLTFGPSFMTLAGTYSGSVIVGLNRRLDQQSNTIDAAKEAVAEIDNLYSIELGNEPNFYTDSDPIADGSWSASKDFDSQVSWQESVGSSLSLSNIFSAGVYFGTNSFNIQGLAEREGSSIEYVKDFCSHNYPQSQFTADLPQLMNHSAITVQVAPYKAEKAAATANGKAYIMGETNSATQGGGGISPTFGAGLWLMDYIMQLQLLGFKAAYFHQGTIGNCQYCWWGRFNMGAPYYGAYFATLALAGADKIAPLDTQTTTQAGYAIYSGDEPVRVLLYNSDYYESGTRSSQTFTLTGLSGKTSVEAKRLTADSSTSRQDRGEIPSLGGQSFEDGTCVIQGSEETETASVSSSGDATFTLAASEALLVYL